MGKFRPDGTRKNNNRGLVKFRNTAERQPKMMELVLFWKKPAEEILDLAFEQLYAGTKTIKNKMDQEEKEAKANEQSKDNSTDSTNGSSSDDSGSRDSSAVAEAAAADNSSTPAA